MENHTLVGQTVRRRRLTRIGACLLLVSFSAAACGGVEDRDTTKSNKGGTGGGGTVDNMGATGGDTDVPIGGAAPKPTPCKEGRMRCEANTPQTCDDEGNWVSGKACGGTTKVCTGDGVCAAYRLVNAGIDSFGVRPPEGAIVLKSQTLSASPRTCNADKTLCVTGGIR